MNTDELNFQWGVLNPSNETFGGARKCFSCDALVSSEEAAYGFEDCSECDKAPMATTEEKK